MNKEQLKIKIYENWYVKLDDVLENEEIDNKLFLNDFKLKSCISYIWIISFFVV